MINRHVCLTNEMALLYVQLSDVMGEGEFGPVVLGVANHIVPTHDKTLVAVKVSLWVSQ